MCSQKRFSRSTSASLDVLADVNMGASISLYIYTHLDIYTQILPYIDTFVAEYHSCMAPLYMCVEHGCYGVATISRLLQIICKINLAIYIETLQHTATHCNTLQHTAIHCNTYMSDTSRYIHRNTATHCNTLQHTATHCNTLQHVYVRHISLYT